MLMHMHTHYTTCPSDKISEDVFSPGQIYKKKPDSFSTKHIPRQTPKTSM